LAITKDKKQQILKGYVDSLNESEAVVLVQSRGLTVAEVTELRNKIRETGGKYSVVKNTLFRLALEQAEKPVPDCVQGPITAMFCPEDIAPTVKALTDFAKELQDREFKVVGGIIGGDVLNGKGAEALASIPTKDTLYAQILTAMNGPATQTAGVLASSIRQVVTVLQAGAVQQVYNVLQARVQQLKEGGAAA
jgi:large subunit ribosomal protein L10